MADQLDMGSVPVDTAAVDIPTEENLKQFAIRRTPDLKWSGFDVTTDRRTVQVEPGNPRVGQAQFDAFCDKVRAMFQAPEGQDLLATIRGWLAAHPIVFDDIAVPIEEVPE